MEAQQIQLSRLLTRLDQTTTSRRAVLESSPYERKKVSHNLDAARNLLLTLEKQATSIKIQSQKTNTQADLQRSREIVKKLTGRLDELSKAAVEDSDDDDDEDESWEEENVLREYAPAVKNVQSGLDTGGTDPLDEKTQSELRARRPLRAEDNREAASTTAREQLFEGSATKTKASQDPALQQTETLLSHNRTEQDALSAGLLGLAQALKASSINFSQSLETEKDTLKRAEKGLDQNAQGMDAAERNMGMLRRMTEGKGWWGRIRLYAMIGALWFFCFVLVFVVPKIRL